MLLSLKAGLCGLSRDERGISKLKVLFVIIIFGILIWLIFGDLIYDFVINLFVTMDDGIREEAAALGR